MYVFGRWKVELFFSLLCEYLALLFFINFHVWSPIECKARYRVYNTILQKIYLEEKKIIAGRTSGSKSLKLGSIKVCYLNGTKRVDIDVRYFFLAYLALSCFVLIELTFNDYERSNTVKKELVIS